MMQSHRDWHGGDAWFDCCCEACVCGARERTWKWCLTQIHFDCHAKKSSTYTVSTLLEPNKKEETTRTSIEMIVCDLGRKWTNSRSKATMYLVPASTIHNWTRETCNCLFTICRWWWRLTKWHAQYRFPFSFTFLISKQGFCSWVQRAQHSPSCHRTVRKWKRKSKQIHPMKKDFIFAVIAYCVRCVLVWTCWVCLTLICAPLYFDCDSSQPTQNTINVFY